MATHLTERVVKAAEIGSRKYVVFDEDCPGFGLCVFESGRKGFVLIYRAAGRPRRFTVGTWPSWSVTAARDEAKRLKRDIDRGEDPIDVRTSARHAPTLEELVERYIDNICQSCPPPVQRIRPACSRRWSCPIGGREK